MYSTKLKEMLRSPFFAYSHLCSLSEVWHAGASDKPRPHPPDPQLGSKDWGHSRLLACSQVSGQSKPNSTEVESNQVSVSFSRGGQKKTVNLFIVAAFEISHSYIICLLCPNLSLFQCNWGRGDTREPFAVCMMKLLTSKISSVYECLLSDCMESWNISQMELSHHIRGCFVLLWCLKHLRTSAAEQKYHHGG